MHDIDEAAREIEFALECEDGTPYILQDQEISFVLHYIYMNFPTHHRGGTILATASADSSIYPEIRGTNVRLGAGLKDEVAAELLPALTRTLIDGGKEGLSSALKFAKAGLKRMRNWIGAEDSLEPKRCALPIETVVASETAIQIKDPTIDIDEQYYTQSDEQL